MAFSKRWRDALGADNGSKEIQLELGLNCNANCEVNCNCKRSNLASSSYRSGYRSRLEVSLVEADSDARYWKERTAVLEERKIEINWLMSAARRKKTICSVWRGLFMKFGGRIAARLQIEIYTLKFNAFDDALLWPTVREQPVRILDRMFAREETERN